MRRTAAALLCVLLVAGVSQMAVAGNRGERSRVSESRSPSVITAGRTAAQADGDASRYSMSSRFLKQAAPNRPAAAGYLPSEVECRTRGVPRDLNLDCDDPVFPNNEPDIEVNPRDPLHMVASSNDYDSCCDGFYTTFNGGRTWIQGDMSAEGPNRIGSDPVTTFDPKTGNVLHSSLNFLITRQGLAKDGDLVVSISRDGGMTWGKPVVVADGRGDDDDPVQVFHDKEWMVTDTNPLSPFYGRTYLTWTRFLSHNGTYVESPIFEAHSDDGGRTWTRPKEISGTSPTCTFQEAGPRGQCDEDQGSVPTVGPDGELHVAFANFQHTAAWERRELFESQYMVVRSRNGGEHFTKPVSVVDLEDGTRDFPVNVDGRQTLTRYQLRVWAMGNIAADPETGKLYLVFADNRRGRRDVRRPVTSTDVYLMTSRDGVSWRGPRRISSSRGDQWFPWVEVNPVNHEIGIVYHSRKRIGGNIYRGAIFAEGRPGAMRYRQLSRSPSRPRNSLFFRAGVEGCRKCATFHGDYNNLDYGTDGKANVVWTDMRRFIDVGSTDGHTENIFFSRVN